MSTSIQARQTNVSENKAESKAVSATKILTKRQKAIRKRVKVTLLQIVGLVVLLGSWELVARTGLADPAFISSPSRFIPAFWIGLADGVTGPLLWQTIYETIVGLAIAVVAGIVFAVVISEWPMLYEMTRPFLTAFNNLPRVALAPLFILWFGLGANSRIALVISVCFFIVLFNTYAGLQTGARDYVLLANVLNASRLVKFRKFIFPSALPSMFAGFQLALTYAFMAAVVGEMLAGSQGLGGYLSLTIGTFRTDDFFGALLLLVFVSTLVSTMLNIIEAKLLAWKED